MNRPLLFAFLSICTTTLMAQNSSHFDYDREKVISAMEQIDEFNVISNPTSLFLPDSITDKPPSLFLYYLAGFIPGCLAPQLGFWTGFLISNLQTAKIGLIIGSTLGFFIPPIAVYQNRQTVRPTLFTGLGVITGTVPGVLLSVGYYDMAKTIQDAIDTTLGCWNTLNDLPMSCTGLYASLAAGTGRLTRLVR
ncbi:MAG: hypothetical protein R6V75_07695 [Bacteroidales bacterium]